MPESSAECDAIGVPRHLHTLERKPEPFGNPSEKLFRRVSPNIDLANGIPPHAFETLNTSVNREKFCESAADVLYSSETADHYFSHSIISLPVGKIDGLVIAHPQVKDKSYVVRVEHTPTACIYPHSEIKVYEAGREVPHIGSKALKLYLKVQFAECAAVVKG